MSRRALARYTTSISAHIVDGDPQECSATNGANVAVEAHFAVEEGDSVQSIDWEVNGFIGAQGASANLFVPLGIDNTVTAHMMTVSGLTASDTVQITIQDTVAGSISAALVDPKSGLELSEVQSGKEVLGIYSVTDTCDPEPNISATVGTDISSGDPIKPKVASGSGGVAVTVESSASSLLEMRAVSTDASGNKSEETISIPVIK